MQNLPPLQIKSVGRYVDVLQRVQDGFVNRVLHALEREDRVGGEGRQRILAGEPDQMNPLAQIGAARQMLAPRPVNLEERHRLLGSTDGLLAGRGHQRGASLGRALPHLRDVAAVNLFDQRLLLRVTIREDDVRLVDTDHRPMRRHDHHVEPVRLTQR